MPKDNSVSFYSDFLGIGKNFPVTVSATVAGAEVRLTVTAATMTRTLDLPVDAARDLAGLIWRQVDEIAANAGEAGGFLPVDRGRKSAAE